MKCNLFFYDITSGSGYPNPSGILWRCGVRLNYSNWLIPEHRTPHSLIRDMVNVGAETVNWHLLPFDETASDKLLLLARTALNAEIERNRASIEVMAARRLERFNEDKDNPERLEKFNKEMTKIVEKAEKLLADLENSAAGFGISLDINGSLDAVKSIKAATEARAAAYGNLTENLANVPGMTDLAAAATRDEVPAGILADAAEENGLDVSAVRTLFSPPTKTEDVLGEDLPNEEDLELEDATL